MILNIIASLVLLLAGLVVFEFVAHYLCQIYEIALGMIWLGLVIWATYRITV